MPPKKAQNEPNPAFTSSERDGLAVAAQVCRVAADSAERDELLAMLGLEPIGELRIRMMRREADRSSDQGRQAPGFNHYPMRRM